MVTFVVKRSPPPNDTDNSCQYLGLTFVTQSPNDLPDGVLGLVNNWVIYKIDEATIRRLKSYIPNSDDSLWALVRGLGPDRALVSFNLHATAGHRRNRSLPGTRLLMAD
jgi:DNA helicase HerA-like ATPase